ncbi:MAG TPA: hypothetical protein PKJ79_16740, partial [Quisquiliibacterium sp.]|nr:hypothetical protein [Quisquiliibacterium sp.]
MSLILLVALALACVVVYNVWSGRRRRARMAGAARPKVEPARSDPGAAGAARSEPSLDLDGALTAERGAADGAAPGGSGAMAASGAGPGGPAAAGRGAARPVLNALADCIVELVPAAPVSGERLLQIAQGMRRVGSKPVVVEGALRRTADEAPVADGGAGDALAPDLVPTASAAGAGDGGSSDTLTASAGDDVAVDADPSVGEAWTWQAPAVGVVFERVRVGVLLANRHGPLNAMEFSEFVAGVQALAEQISALADTPDMNSVLARARTLDDTCAQLDAQLGIGVETREPMGLADLAREAEAGGCVERGNNRYARLGPSGEVLFSIAALGIICGVLLKLFLLAGNTNDRAADIQDAQVAVASTAETL